MVSPRAATALAFVDGYRNWKRGRDKIWTLLIKDAFASFGQRSVLALPIRLAGVEGISIGSGVFVGPGSWLQTLPHEPGSARLVLGDNTSIAGSAVISAVEDVRLGRSVLLAKNVYISDHIHAYLRDDMAIRDQGLARIEPVRVDDGAWLGQGVVVLPGVTIGARSVIGANSVVTSDIPERCIAVGAPAKVVRTLDLQ